MDSKKFELFSKALTFICLCYSRDEGADLINHRVVPYIEEGQPPAAVMVGTLEKATGKASA